MTRAIVTGLLLGAGLLCGAVHAQESPLRLLYQTPENIRPAQFFSASALTSTSHDALWPPGLVLTREDDSGSLTGVMTVLPGTREVTWQLTEEDVNAIAPGVVELLAFANLFGDGIRYPFFYIDDFIIGLNPRTNQAVFSSPENWIEPEVRIADVTGDGRDDVIVYLPDVGQVQIWGDDDRIHGKNLP